MTACVSLVLPSCRLNLLVDVPFRGTKSDDCVICCSLTYEARMKLVL